MVSSPATRHESDASTASSHENPFPPSPLTAFNGIGQWHNWTRSFNDPVMALLDLMDNAFDASGGDIRVAPYFGEEKTKEGIYIQNSCAKPIKPMEQILQIYQSSKGDSSHIGENGVGIKQGCASLSDLSFCITKSNGVFSLGIIAKSLQRIDGCSLPSHVFKNGLPSMDELEEEFADRFREAECIKAFGNGSLERGMNCLLEHFDRVDVMNSDHVFLVIIHHLKHGAASDEDSQKRGTARQILQATKHPHAANAESLLEQLKEEMPRQYIHVPSSVNVFVGDELIRFSYWQKKLVELSCFIIHIDPRHLYSDAQDWKNPTEYYPLKVYCGFDPDGVSGRNKSSPASLYIYSRLSGRLIRHYEDARTLLKLTTSGTNFAQGLTILVDDVNGNLPLNPTKQDLAFGLESHGETHRKNLYAWLSAVTHLYYHFHLSKFPGKQKGLLTTAIDKLVDRLANQDFPPLHECNFTRFIEADWTKVANGAIRAKKLHHRRVVGVDTRIHIEPPPVVLPPPAAARPVPAVRHPSAAAQSPPVVRPPPAAGALPVRPLSPVVVEAARLPIARHPAATLDGAPLMAVSHVLAQKRSADTAGIPAETRIPRKRPAMNGPLFSDEDEEVQDTVADLRRQLETSKRQETKLLRALDDHKAFSERKRRECDQLSLQKDAFANASSQLKQEKEQLEKECSDLVKRNQKLEKEKTSARKSLSNFRVTMKELVEQKVEAERKSAALERQVQELQMRMSESN